MLLLNRYMSAKTPLPPRLLQNQTKTLDYIPTATTNTLHSLPPPSPPLQGILSPRIHSMLHFNRRNHSEHVNCQLSRLPNRLFHPELSESWTPAPAHAASPAETPPSAAAAAMNCPAASPRLGPFQARLPLPPRMAENVAVAPEGLTRQEGAGHALGGGDTGAIAVIKFA